MSPPIDDVADDPRVGWDADTDFLSPRDGLPPFEELWDGRCALCRSRSGRLVEPLPGEAPA